MSKKASKHELDLFFIHKGILYKDINDISLKFLALVVPKSWKFTILYESHDKMGHQGNNRTYSFIK